MRLQAALGAPTPLDRSSHFWLDEYSTPRVSPNQHLGSPESVIEAVAVYGTNGSSALGPYIPGTGTPLSRR